MIKSYNLLSVLLAVPLLCFCMRTYMSENMSVSTCVCACECASARVCVLVCLRRGAVHVSRHVNAQNETYRDQLLTHFPFPTLLLLPLILTMTHQAYQPW